MTTTQTPEAKIRDLETRIFAADDEALLLEIERDSWQARIDSAHALRSRLIAQWESETGGSWADLMS